MKYIIYCRKSRLEEDGLEIERQIELCTDYCIKNNLEFIVFAEEGSSEDWFRPEFQKVIALIKNNSKEYKGIIVTDTDRISRERTDVGIFIRDVLLKYNVKEIHTSDKVYDLDNEEDLLTLGLRSQIDEYVMKITKKKLLRGRIQAIKKGVWFGKRLLGYDKHPTTKKLVRSESEAPIIEIIFEQYVNNHKTQQGIADELNLLGYKTMDGNSFTGRSVSIILTNRTYLGEINYELSKGEFIHVPNAHKPLVDIGTFNKAQEIKKQQRRVGENSKMKIYALSKLVKCPKCKVTLSFDRKYCYREARKTGNKGEKTLYTTNCLQVTNIKVKKDPNFVKCSNLSVKVERLYKEVIEDLKKKIHSLEEEIESLVLGNIDASQRAKLQVDELQKRLKQLDNERTKVQSGFRAGIYNEEEAQKEIQIIEEQKQQIKERIIQTESITNVTEIEKKEELKNKIEQFLSEEPQDERKANIMLREIIETVWYYKEKKDSAYKVAPFEIHIDYKE